MGDVGASRAAVQIIQNLDNRLQNPARIVVRYSGFILLLLVVYIHFGFEAVGPNSGSIYLWLGSYLIYNISLEFLRVYFAGQYDTVVFRSVRIILNLILLSCLILIAPNTRFILGMFYAIPIFASIVYFSNKLYIPFFVFFCSAIGLYLGGIYFSPNFPLKFSQYFLIITMLALLNILAARFYRKAFANSNSIVDISSVLNPIRDLNILAKTIVSIYSKLTGLKQIILIVMNPKNHRYITHSIRGFNLEETEKINLAIKNCILAGEKETEKLETDSFYSKFLYDNSRRFSLRIIKDPTKQTIAIVMICHPKLKQIDNLTSNLMLQAETLISNALENCINYRQAELGKAKYFRNKFGLQITDEENDIVQEISKEVLRHFPSAEGCVIHRHVSNAELLEPIAGMVKGELHPWYSTHPRNGNDNKFPIGKGVAGISLLYNEIIRISDTSSNPYFVRLESDHEIRSLLTAPLILNDDDRIGTISIHSQKYDAFSLDDEFMLASLAHEGVQLLSEAREFRDWRSHGGLIKQVVNAFQEIRIGVDDTELCLQITKLAVKLLGFELARIRLLDSENNQLVTVAAEGVPDYDLRKVYNQNLPVLVLDSILLEKYKIGNSYLISTESTDWKKVANKYFYIPRDSKDKKLGWLSYNALIVPLRNISSELIGILTLDVPRNGNLPTQQLIEAIDVFSSASEWVIELSRIQRRLVIHQENTEQLITTISEEFVKLRDLRSIGDLVVQIGAGLLNCDGCSLFLVDSNSLVLTNSTYLSASSFIGSITNISATPKSGLVSWVAATGEKLNFNNNLHSHHIAWCTEKDSRYLLPNSKCSSLILVPIKNGEKIIGVVCLINKRGLKGNNSFDENDIRLANYLAQQAGSAIKSFNTNERIQKWENLGFEDDLHELKNWYRFGVVAYIESLNFWLDQGDIDKVKKDMPQLHRRATTTMYELSTLHSAVASKYLEERNVRKALEVLVDAWVFRVVKKHKEQMRINIDCPENLQLPGQIQNTLLRIASNAFTNSILHSGILENPEIQIDIKLEKKEDYILLEITDNGKGATQIIDGYGIKRMKDLTALLRESNNPAELTIVPTIGNGVRVQVKVQSKE